MLGSEPLLPLQILVQDVPGLQSGSVLDSLLRLVQGPLRCVTPTRYSRKLEEKVAERFRVGSGLKIPRTKKARLAKEGLLAGSSSLSLDTYKSISDEFHTPATSVSGSQRSIKFEGGFEAQKSVERPVGTSQDKGKRAVDLPQVVVTLDGQEIHHKDENVKDSIASFQFEESDEDTGHAAVAHVNLQDLDKLEKSLKAWPEAQEYLKDHSVEELVLKYFQDIYGDDVACVNVIPSQAALFPLINSYKATSQALEDLLNEYSYAIKRKLKLKIKAIRVFGPVYGAWGTKRFGKKSAKVEAIVFYMARLAELNNQIAMGQAQADASAEPSAFVTFRSRVAQTTASTALQDHDTGAWTVSPAPGPKEIIWSNVGMRSWFRGLRSLAVDASYLLLVLFYGAPVTIAQAWLTSTVLPITPDIFKSLIPGLVLKLFLAILPSILGFFALIRGAQSQSRIQWEMVERYFPFMVIVVFIFQLFGQLASDMVALGNIIVNNPTIIFSLIASYAPRQAWFFTSYVLVLGLSGRAIQFLNPVPLVLFWLKSSTAVTSAAKARVLNSIFFVYGAQIPYDTMNILLGLVFAVQNPMLPLVVLIAFLTGTFVFRYNLLYVYSEQFQSGGAVWPTVVNQILTGLVIFQIFMVGMFTLYNQPPCALIMFLTLLFTAGYWVVLTKAFNRPQRVMSMKAAAEMDRKNGVLEISSETLQRVYQPVVMRDNDAVHRDLMQQAQQILNKISADKGYQSLKALKEVPVPDDTCDAASPSSSQVAGQYSPLHDPTAAEAASLAQPSLPVSSNLRPTDTAE